MIVSRSADYALRAMIYIARQSGTRFVPLNEIATEMKTPPFLLSRLMQHLVKAGLLLSMKGHHGGFRLIKGSGDVTAAEILRSIDGPFEAFDCTGIAACGLRGQCTLLGMFSRAERALDEVFSSVTLEDLAHLPHGQRLGATSRVRFDIDRNEQVGGR